MTKINESISEAVGALIGDGCISKWKRGKSFRWALLFTGSWKNDSAYYAERIKPIMDREFGIRSRIYHRKDDDTVRYWVMDIHTIEFFQDLGIPVGKKIKLRIPKAITKDKNLLRSCISGIFNTDGSVYSRYSKPYKNHKRLYKYAVVQFKMKEKELMKQIKTGLETLGFKTTRITPDSGSWAVRICDQNAIENFMQEMDVSKYHLQRYKVIKGIP